MSDDSRKKILELIYDKSTKPKNEKSIPSRVSFSKSCVGELNLRHREAWSVITKARKTNPLLDSALKTLKITSGLSFISHFYDLAMEPYLRDYLDETDRECSDIIKELIPSFAELLPRSYSLLLTKLISPTLWTSPKLWTQEWQERNRC